MKKFVSRLTYANVVATLALFLVLTGGAAYAAVHLGRNSVGTKQIKNNAITAAKIKKGSVTGAKIKLSSLGTVPSATSAATAANATNAVNAVNAANATTATSSANAAALGGVAAAGYQGRTMWALVGNSGRILSQSGGISIQGRVKGGTWLDFPRAVSGKGIFVTSTAVDNRLETSLEAAPCGYVSETATPGSIACDHGTNTLSDAFVATDDGGEGAELGFYVVVVP